jgi:hypothetical protein
MIQEPEYELWMEVEDAEYPNKYAVSTFGRVCNIETGYILKQYVNHWGYWKVNVHSPFNSKKHSARFVSRLVALAFIPQVDGKPTVDHIDRDKTNNHVSNLRWADRSEQNLNKDYVINAKHYAISFQATGNRTKKISVAWKQDGKQRAKYFLSKQEAESWATENLRGKDFLQKLNKQSRRRRT